MHVRYTALVQWLGLLVLMTDGLVDGSTGSLNTAPWFRTHFPLLGRTSQGNAICCLPQAWEARSFFDWGSVNLFFGVSYNNGSIHTGFGLLDQKFFFDIKSKFWILDTLTGSGAMIRLDDYKEGKSYDVDVDGKYTDCQIDSTLGNLTLPCIPGNATLLSRGVFGDKKLPVSTYSFDGMVATVYINSNATLLSRGVFGDKKLPVSTYSFDGMVATVYINTTVEPRQCRPVHVWQTDLVKAGFDLRSYSVLDLGPIKSRDIFHIPKACRNMTNPDTSWD